ncbi:unnamed protein product [Moneuplotes crassus]|uniref:Uncharacterized protein n=1 Tax=Euplotes crassus TaxID=5936 RepID=A0AAD1XZG6_EUPCR|nr:unnamed protein product [Moneuplotes crassus]
MTLNPDDKAKFIQMHSAAHKADLADQEKLKTKAGLHLIRNIQLLTSHHAFEKLHKYDEVQNKQEDPKLREQANFLQAKRANLQRAIEENSRKIEEKHAQLRERMAMENEHHEMLDELRKRMMMMQRQICCIEEEKVMMDHDCQVLQAEIDAISKSSEA